MLQIITASTKDLTCIIPELTCKYPEVCRVWEDISKSSMWYVLNNNSQQYIIEYLLFTILVNFQHVYQNNSIILNEICRRLQNLRFSSVTDSKALYTTDAQFKGLFICARLAR